MTSAGLAHLERVGTLIELDLRNTAVADDGLEHVTKLSKLRVFHVGQTQVTRAGVKRLKASLPVCFMPPFDAELEAK